MNGLHLSLSPHVLHATHCAVRKVGSNQKHLMNFPISLLIAINKHRDIFIIFFALSHWSLKTSINNLFFLFCCRTETNLPEANWINVLLINNKIKLNTRKTVWSHSKNQSSKVYVLVVFICSRCALPRNQIHISTSKNFLTNVLESSLYWIKDSTDLLWILQSDQFCYWPILPRAFFFSLVTLISKNNYKVFKIEIV